MIRSLPHKEVHRITSGQVITDVTSVAKELVENLIDANSSKIDITFTNHGVDGIDVSDDGDGVPEADHALLCLKHHTSKLGDFSELESVHTLGFRGEALGSLCGVASVLVTTCTKDAYPRATVLEFDRMGVLAKLKKQLGQKGTTVRVHGLFKHLPVRQKTLVKNARREFNKAINGLIPYLLVYPEIRFTIFHVMKGRKTLLMGTRGNSTILDNLVSVYGTNGLYGMIPVKLEVTDVDTQRLRLSHGGKMSLTVSGYISNCSFGLGRLAADRQFVYVNRRPITLKKFLKTVNEIFKGFNHVQSPVVVLNIDIDVKYLDVNVTPDKRIVMIQNEDVINEMVAERLTEFYLQQANVVPKSRLEPLTMDVRALVKVEKEEGGPKSTKREKEEKEQEPEQSQEESEVEEAGEEQSEEEEEERAETEEAEEERAAESEEEEAGETAAETEEAAGERAETEEEAAGVAETEEELVNGSEAAPETESTSDMDVDEKETEVEEKVAEPNLLVPQEADTEKVTPAVRLAARPAARPATSPAIPSSPAEEDPSLDQDDVAPNIDPTRQARTPLPASPCSELENIPTGDLLEMMENDPASGKLFVGDTLRISVGDHVQEHRAKRPKVMNGRNDVVFSKVRDGLHRYRSTMRVCVDDMQVKPAFDDGDAPATGVHVDNIEEKHAAEDKLSYTFNKQDFSAMRVIGQFNLGFILVTVPKSSNLFIIDQHASDEKFNYEKYLQTITFDENTQVLIQPRRLELNIIDEMVVYEHMDVFKHNGFAVKFDDTEPPGQRICLTSLPVSKHTEFGLDDFHELIHLIREKSRVSHTIKCSKWERLLASRACRTSIMIGQLLTLAKMTQVVHNLSTLNKPWNCPHGRPTMRHLVELQQMPRVTLDYST